MNEKISELMDGELERDDALRLIRQLAADEARRDVWDDYHLIGDTLRGEVAGEAERLRASREAIFARLAAEPTVLAPHAIPQPKVEKRTRIALAMAASVVAVSAVAIVGFKQQGGVVAPVQLVQQGAPKPIANAPLSASEVRVNDYLAIHRQFANPDALQAASVRRDSVPMAQGAR
ncbi:MAG: sigma-E factor negative regulatory protein [Burkholderiales bacterium]|jgi:sigma-E factor negative regulatory protein RseA